jgi:hypothetical protein
MCAASVAMPSDMSISAVIPAPASAAPWRRPRALEHELGGGRWPRAPLPHGERGGGCAERAGHADEITGARTVAPDQRLRPLDPADGGHGDGERRRAHNVPAGDHGPVLPCQLLCAADELQRALLGKALGKAEQEIRLAGVRAHRGEVREGARDGEPPDLLRRVPSAVQAEVNALDDRVERGDGDRPCADDRGVVPHASEQSRRRRRCAGGGRGRRGRARRAELGSDRVDQ